MLPTNLPARASSSRLRWDVAEFHGHPDGRNATCGGLGKCPPLLAAILSILPRDICMGASAAPRVLAPTQATQAALRRAPRRQRLGRLCGCARRSTPCSARRCTVSAGCRPFPRAACWSGARQAEGLRRGCWGDGAGAQQCDWYACLSRSGRRGAGTGVCGGGCKSCLRGDKLRKAAGIQA